MKRSSGILLSISSLPSPYGIGTLGKAAYQFADFLHAAGQKYWQMLPLGPTSYGDSPYQSFSSFAGNPYFIDPDMLIADKLLTKKDLKGIDFGTDPRHIDYGKVYEGRFRILAIAKENGWERDQKDVSEWEKENAWVRDYALYMACKRHFQMQSWTEWKDKKLRFRDAETLEKYRTELKEDVELFTYIQFLFYKQWNALRKYLKELDIQTIGDVPIYVPLDSADVWSEPQFFDLDENYVPNKVAGVPPDYFSADGQLWGNPLYNWDRMRDDGFGWWIRRIGGATKLFDVIRIDHFRGFSEYWAVPYGDKTAKNGKWMTGPGNRMVSAVTGWFRENKFIAEDLGAPSEGLRQLLKESGLPGMKVLEFAFDSGEESSFLPHTYTNHCICYTGTHDNATLLEWLEDASAHDVAFAFDYLGIDSPAVSAYLSAAEKAKEADSKKALKKGGNKTDTPEAIADKSDVPEITEDKAGVPKVIADKTAASESITEKAVSVKTDTAQKSALEKLPKKLVLTDEDKHRFIWQVIRAGQRSVADLFIVQMQDYLELGKGNRMNVPAIASGNWSWRLLPEEMNKNLAKEIAHVTKLYGR